MYYLTIQEFEKANEGSLFIKKNNKLVAIDKRELLKEIKDIEKDILEIKEEQRAINNMNKFFDLYSKPHFQLVFNDFKIQILGGFIEVEEESILVLDKMVLENKISVKEALEKHEYLKNKFNELFINNKKELKGFWEI